MPQLLLFCCSLLYSYDLRATTIRGWRLFLWKACRHQEYKVSTSNTVMTVRHCQFYMQPLSPSVSCGTELYNTNSPVVSPVSIVRNYLHTCSAYTTHGYFMRAAFVLLRALDCVATIQGRWLFEGSIFSKKYSMLRNSRHTFVYTCNYILLLSH